MKNKYLLTFYSLLILLAPNLVKGTNLGVGDLAISSFNADGNDEFSFVLLTDITGTTTVYFTENGWDDDADGGGAAPTWGNTTEGTLTWTFTGNLSCGTEVQVVSPSNASLSANNGGSTTGHAISRSGSWGISGTGDVIFAYTGTGIPNNGTEVTNFIWAFNSGSAGFVSNASTTTTTGLPASLTLGTNAVDAGSTDDNFQYDCSTTSPTASLRSALADITNFTKGVNSENYQGPACSYACIAVSPPSVTITVDSNVSCNGGSDGGVTATATSGTMPYTYSWSTGASTASISGLVAGTYTITVTDNSGNTATNSATITEPTALTVSFSKSDVFCNGSSTGSAMANASGGTGSYTYLWNIGATTQTISNLSAGTYTATVTDANSCTTSGSITINEPTLITPNSSSTNVSCNGGSDGSINLNTSGGIPNYTFAWSNGATTDDINSLFAGTYTVTITDALGCTVTESTTITEPAALIAAAVVDSNVSVNGGSDGGATASATGGIAPYTYLWSNAATTASITGVTAGTYTVTVTDNSGCTDAESATITEPAALAVNVVIDSNVSCNGFSDGGATASATGGTIPYTYLWSNSATTASITGVTTGTYTVTITDNNGITATNSGTITEPVTLVAAAVVDSNVSVNGGSDGGATASATGGTAAYTYSWSNGATTASITGVTAGTYTVTITDNNGCTDTESATITEPTALAANVVIDSNVSCNGFSDGGATASATGGIAPYTYIWSNTATTASITGVSAGTYTVTVTDNNGATATNSGTITEPVTLVAAAVVDSNVSVNGGSDGGATASATGGTAAYTYSWSNGATTASITGVTAGTYTVTITDNNGCTDTESATITEPTTLAANVVIDSNVSCNGFSDGGATASATGGIAPYTYIWSNTATTASITGVSAGTYTVTVTDNNGATATNSGTITEPVTLVAAVVVDSNVSVNGGSDGGATASATGGTAAYTYSWSNGATTASITGVTAGTYTVTITDNNGCTDTESATITEPAVVGPLANLIITEINYNGPEAGTDTSEFIEFVNAGNMTVNLDGYSFGQGVTHTFNANDSITSGQYFVIAFDSSGFRNTYGINADAVWTSGGLSNGGEDITIVDNIGRTVDSVDYDDNTPWPSGTTAGGPDGGGSSIVLCDTLSDNNDGANWSRAISPIVGVIINGEQVFGNPGMSGACPTPIVVVTVVDSNVSCNGGMDGGATAAATGGLAPYTFSWSNGATTASITGLSAGTYTITVTDNLGTSEVDSAIITEPMALVASITVDSNVTTNGGANGGATATATGGTAAYTYSWSNGATTASITGVMAGTYTVTVTDANGCTDTESAVITEPASVSVTFVVADVSCNGGSDGSVNVTATGGTMPYTYTWSNGATVPNISALAAGTYTVTITDNNGTTKVDSATVNEPTAITLAFAVTNESASGAADGAVDLTVNGGTAGYTFVWDNGAVTEDLASLTAGTYCVTVTDANGCTNTGCATVSVPGALANLIITEINYNGPEAGTDTSEFIEFVNAGTATVNLNGYSFVQGVTHTFTSNDSITSGQYFVIAFDSSGFRNTYGIDADAIWSSGGLSNGGEDITIVDDFGRTVDSVDFDDATPWPSGSAAGEPDGGGASIELVDSLLDNNDGANWQASISPVAGQIVNGLQVFGTPGARPILVGLLEQPKAEALKFYPNPTRGALTIELSSSNIGDRLQLINIEGKVLRDEIIKTQKMNMNLEDYSDGIYFVRIGSTTKKLILNK